MAAVYALVLVPALAAALFMLGTTGSSFVDKAAVFAFLALLIGMLTGLFKLIIRWEDDDAAA